MEQSPLFSEDIYEALKADAMAIGGSKVVGHMLWPEKAADKAGELFNNCMNRTRPEKLDPEQVLFIKREARKVSSFATVTFEAQETGFEVPKPIEPEDEAARLQREFVQAQEAMQQMLKRMEKLSLPTVRGVA